MTGDIIWPFPAQNTEELVKILLGLYQDKQQRDFRSSYLPSANLSQQELASIDLSGSGLFASNFAVSNLLAANLGYAYLGYAYFGYANLDYAYLSHAYLADADFSYANLNYADLSYAYLDAAKLRETNLIKANLSYTYLVGADLTNANLTDANLTGAILTGAILTGANLTGVTLTTEQNNSLAQPIWYSLHQGKSSTTTSNTYVNIPDFEQLHIDLSTDAELLLTLNVPDTWNNKEGIFSWFAIAVDEQIVAKGVYNGATPGQRLPITVSTVQKLTKGTHTVTAKWQTDNGGELAIGAFGTAFLSASLVSTSAEITKKLGRIIVNHDEWTLGNAGFNNAPDTAIFATNIAKWFTGGSPGKFHAYSTNFGLVESKLEETMTNAGHTWTKGLNIKFDLPTLLTYDGIFIGGDTVDNQVLISYIKAGGNVYLMGGTGDGGAAAEAARWNTFLAAFGLEFGNQYNQIGGNIAVHSLHPLLVGVKALYQSNGNSITNLQPNDPKNSIIHRYNDGQGLIAVFDGSLSESLPVGEKIEKLQQLLSFDGDDYIEVKDPFANTTDFTISLFLKPGILNNGWHGFIGKQGDARRKPGMWICPDSNGLYCDSYDRSGVRYGNQFNNFFTSTDQWVHIAWVKKGTEYNVYRNGTLFATKPAPENFYTDQNTSYWIGRVDNFLIGKIADVRIWSIARTQEEIRKDLLYRLTGSEIGLNCYWPLNEGSSHIAGDKTGKGNNGTINGATWQQEEIQISEFTVA